MTAPLVRARAPGRVNLIGDHTDHSGGLVLPMAIDRETLVEGCPGGRVVRLRSASAVEEARVALGEADPGRLSPPWARYVGGVVAELRPRTGFTGTLSSTVPPGGGLSSSAALEVALALALGFEGEPVELARLCQRAEQRAAGVPCGIMDPLVSAAGIEGHALLIDCRTLEISPVAVPDEVEVVVVHSGEPRALAGSAYAERREQCEAAQARIGPLREATLSDLEELRDPVLRRRARHVIRENQRVRAFVEALVRGDLARAGILMLESHRSLRDDFEVSTPALDAVVGRLCSTRGVLGARLTGAGFGGCVVALVRPGTRIEGWRVRPAGRACRY